MTSKKLLERLAQALQAKRKEGVYKTERIIIGPQGPEVLMAGSPAPLLNFCSNNYLGLSNHPEIKEAARRAMGEHGFGMSSVRFICGTQDLHKHMEESLSQFLQTEDTLLYSSCFDANGGLFENFLDAEDVVISASLNHASIIDGVRLSKARRLVYKYNDRDELEARLKESADFKVRAVVTDGVFSMEGELAPLDKIVPLCKSYEALLVVDDSHAVGFMGEKGRGTGEYLGAHEGIDLFTGTLGKALGGAAGGYISGKKEFIDWFRNTSRPYLFSNSLPPPLVAGAIKALEIVMGSEGEELRNRLRTNARYFRDEMTKSGFNIKKGIHPIVPILLGDARVAAGMAEDLLQEGIYVVGFSYPVVPKGLARIRIQISAVHSREQLDRAIRAFEKLGRKYGVI